MNEDEKEKRVNEIIDKMFDAVRDGYWSFDPPLLPDGTYGPSYTVPVDNFNKLMKLVDTTLAYTKTKP